MSGEVFFAALGILLVLGLFFWKLWCDVLSELDEGQDATLKEILKRNLNEN